MPLVEQELFTLPEHLSSSFGFCGVAVAQSLVKIHFVQDNDLLYKQQH
jgi:hypothetical protein